MIFRSRIRFAVVFVVALGGVPAIAGEADVVDVKVTQTGSGTYRFDVTVAHADSGWDHYADAFEILQPDGTIIGTRVLAHPHEHEQPFTRSLSGVEVPQALTQVRVRAHDSVHEYGGAEMLVDLPVR